VLSSTIDFAAGARTQIKGRNLRKREFVEIERTLNLSKIRDYLYFGLRNA
jgi:hypothetical protein